MDPEASAIVYDAGIPVVAVGLDVTMQCRLSEEHLRRMNESKFENVLFLRKLISIWQAENENRTPILHDPLAVAVIVRPDFVTTLAGHVDVETRGVPDRTYGMTLFRKDPKGNVRVAQEVTAAALVGFFIDRVAAAPRHP